jgi:hypothetical protein
MKTPSWIFTEVEFYEPLIHSLNCDKCGAKETLYIGGAPTILVQDYIRKFTDHHKHEQWTNKPSQNLP